MPTMSASLQPNDQLHARSSSLVAGHESMMCAFHSLTTVLKKFQQQLL